MHFKRKKSEKNLRSPLYAMSDNVLIRYSRDSRFFRVRNNYLKSFPVRPSLICNAVRFALDVPSPKLGRISFPRP